MKKKSTRPELPPIKPTPLVEFYDVCTCFGRGARYDYKTDPVSAKTCDRCNGTGYHIRTHAHGTRCSDAFPGHCSSCKCECYDCKHVRSAKPQWEEFEERHKVHPGNGYPGKFVDWGTEPFHTATSGPYRFAILQPWPTAGLVWHLCRVDSSGKVTTSEGAYARSSGAFYDALPSECNAYQSGDALVDARGDAKREMDRMVTFGESLMRSIEERKKTHCSGSYLGRFALPNEIASKEFSCSVCSARFTIDSELAQEKPQIRAPQHAPICRA